MKFQLLLLLGEQENLGEHHDMQRGYSQCQCPIILISSCNGSSNMYNSSAPYWQQRDKDTNTPQQHCRSNTGAAVSERKEGKKVKFG